MKIVSVNIGKKREVLLKGKIIETGIYKTQVNQAIFLDENHVKGDTIVDRVHHGGINQAVYGYSMKHYNFWQKKYDFVKTNFGLFGENITFDCLDETKIYVGNVYQCGEVVIEATEPRQPCFKLGLVFKTQKIVKEFWNSTKSGVYFKVLQKGSVQAGDEFVLVKEAKDNPTIAEVYSNYRKKKSE